MTDQQQSTEPNPGPVPPTQDVAAPPQDDVSALLGVESFPLEYLTRDAKPNGLPPVQAPEQKQPSPPPTQPSTDE